MEKNRMRQQRREVHISDTQAIQESIRKLREPMRFHGFDQFLMKKWNSDMPGDFSGCSKEQQKQMRKKAHQNFNQAIKGKKVADAHTIRKWFGLEGSGKPNRDTVFRLAFALKLSPREAREYLVEGMLVPGIQLNDYREMIYMYGLENQLDMDVCDRMIDIFEREMNRDQVMEQKTHTEQLRKMYQLHCQESPEDFLHWLCQNAGMFKGYSKTSLNAFSGLKQEIQEMIRGEAKVCLDVLLQETGYYGWKREQGIAEDTETSVRQYVKHELRRKSVAMDAEIADSIRWLAPMVYGEEKNSDFISELYAAAMRKDGNSKKRYREKESYTTPRSIRFLTDKHLSQLLTVGEQKERLLRFQLGLAELKSYEKNQRCPEWIEKLLKRGNKEVCEISVAEAEKELAYRIGHQKQRCHLVSREDLLPLLHYIAQHRYFLSIQEDMRRYRKEEAIQYFETLANATLLSCQMATVNPEYELDYLLLSGFCENDMYSLSDLIDEAERKE